MQSVGLKEWALVCEALGRGGQTILLRKGGIAEGRDGFGFRHSEFFLFPTFFHEQVDRVRVDDAEIPETRSGEIEIRFFVRVIAVEYITSWETATALEPLHVLQPSVVRERFDYDEAPGLHVALVRVFRLAPSWIFPDAPGYAGCRSWVKLPESAPATTLKPVLTNRKHEERARQFRAVCPLRP
jgi:hypothetical protein